MVHDRIASSLLASGLLTAALLVPVSGAWAQAGRSISTSGKAGSPGKIYEPLDPPAASSPADPARAMFEEMERFQREMDEFFARRFENFGTMPPMPRTPSAPGFGSFGAPGWPGSRMPMLRQSLNLRDEGDRYVVDLDLPEKDQPSVEVKVEGRMLRISSTRKELSEQNAPGMQSRSRMSSSFQQAVTLPGPVKADAVRVERDQGRVQVVVPKA